MTSLESHLFPSTSVLESAVKIGRAEASPEMGTWGEAERLVQPTGYGRFPCYGAETHWRAHDGSRVRLEGLLAEGMRQSGIE
jgi:hypothetical protein